MKWGVFFLVAAWVMSSAWADDDDEAPVAVPVGEVSAAVQTVPLRQQILSDEVGAYGVVAIDARRARTLIVARTGQVLTVFVTAGQRVSKGAPLVAFATGPNATLIYRHAELAVRYAQAERSRVAQLQSQRLATRSQLGVADRALADAEAGLAAQRAIGVGAGTVQVVAPFDALVTAVLVAPGEHLASSAPLVRLAKLGAQQAVLGVEPGDAARVRPGMPVQILAVFGAARSVSGRVVQVSGVINAQTQKVDVLVDFPGDGWLMGTRVRARIGLNRHLYTVVPRSAVLEDGRGSYVFQVRQHKARRVTVQTGLEQAGLVAVSGALMADAPVVSSGNYELQDGMTVRSGR